MEKNYFFVFIYIFFIPAFSFAQNLGEYKVTVEVIKVCGHGTPDDGGQEYRWRFWGRLSGESDSQWRGGGAMGINDAPGGTCLDEANNPPLGADLPYTIFERTFSYPTNKVVAIEIQAEGYEKNCFPGNSSNGHDLNYKEDCWCSAVFFDVRCNDKDDKDHRKPPPFLRTLTIDNAIGQGTWDFPASTMGDKYSFVLRYTVTPPVMNPPEFAYADEFDVDNLKASDTEVICANEDYYVFWNDKTYPDNKVEQLIWYENVDDAIIKIGERTEVDWDCITSVRTRCTGCRESTGSMEHCGYVCDEEPCYSTVSIYAPDWKEVAITTRSSPYGLFAIKLPASAIDAEQMTKRYAVKAVTAEGITNIDFSLPSKPITIYPPPPETKGLPENTTNLVLYPDEDYFVSNPYIDIQHVQCKGDASGSIGIKKIDDNRSFYYTLHPLDGQGGGGNIGSRPAPSVSNPVVFNALKSGRYKLNIGIVNSLGKELCYSEDIIIIKEPAALPTATAKVFEYIGGANVSCHDSEDGMITLSASGGIPPYSYTLIGSNGYDLTQQGDSVFSGLPPLDKDGQSISYTYEISDKYGCFYRGQEKIILELPKPVEFALAEPVNRYVNPNNANEWFDISCHGGTDALEFTLTGGAGPYMLYVGEELKATTQGVSQQAIIDGLKADTTYVVTVSDANGCSNTASVSLAQPDEIVLSTYQIVPATCYGSASASLGIKASGGLPFPGQSYLYTIRHLDVPPDIDFPFAPEESIDSPVDSAVFTNLIAGSYAIIMEDAFGCIGIDTVYISEPDQLSTTVTTTSIQCVGDDNGAAAVLMAGGTAPYTITWTNEFKKLLKTTVVAEGESATIEGLSGGLYYVFVEDANACRYPQSGTPFTIQEPAMELDIFYKDLAHASCYGKADGSVTLQASGGWRNVPYQFGLDKSALSYNNNVYSQLEPGPYTFYVQDGKGCMDSVHLIIEEPQALQVSMKQLDDVSCYGGADGSFELTVSGGVLPYRYSLDGGLSWSDKGVFDGLSKGDYSVIVEDANATCPLIKEIHIQEPRPLQIILAENKATSCGIAEGSAKVQVNGGTPPYTYEWKSMNGEILGTSLSIENLASGQYLFSVFDHNDCQANKVVAVSNPEGPQVEIASIVPVSCYEGNDGSARIKVTSSNSETIITWPDGQQGEQATGLTAGDYIVEVRDESMCVTFVSLTVPEPEGLAIDYAVKEPACYGGCDGAITLKAQGGNGDYTYTWEDGFQGAYKESLCAGSYEVTVVDGQGCRTSTIITMLEPNPIVPGLGGEITICEGQQYQLDAGQPGGTYIWTSNVGFTANTRKVTIDKPGTYEVEVTDANGCKGKESFVLKVSNEILEAEFLVLTEAMAGDTVVLVNISYPEPEESRWFFSDEVVALDTYGYHQQLIFPKEGSYRVSLYTKLANCEAEMTKQILVTSKSGEVSEDVFGHKEELITEFSIYPNPNDGRFTAVVVLQEKEDIRLKLIDIQGQRELGDFTGKGNETYEVDYDFNDLPQGVYFLLLEVDGATKTLKVLIK